VVGGYFDVMAGDRLESVYGQLKTSESSKGVRETYPYVQAWTVDIGGSPGAYHNGGIWPFLNLVDATSRFRHGHSRDAERILREVSEGETSPSGAIMPVEYL
jgi:hypothetical protein